MGIIHSSRVGSNSSISNNFKQQDFNTLNAKKKFETNSHARFRCVLNIPFRQS